MKRIIAISLTLLVALSVLSSCSSKENYKAGSAPPMEGANNTGMVAEKAQASDQKQVTPQNKIKAQKIIKNAGIDCESKNVNDAYSKIIDWAKKNGGYEFNQTKENTDNFIRINSVIKIKSENLDEFIKFISKNTIIINQSINSENKTDEYYDAEIRLNTKKESLKKYYDLLQKTNTIDDILKINTFIDNLTAEIEGLENQIKNIDAQASESTVTISISQIDDPNKPKQDFSFSALSLNGLFSYISNGFLIVVNGIVLALQWGIISIFAISPLIIIVIIIIWILKRNKKKNQE